MKKLNNQVDNYISCENLFNAINFYWMNISKLYSSKYIRNKAIRSKSNAKDYETEKARTYDFSNRNSKEGTPKKRRAVPSLLDNFDFIQRSLAFVCDRNYADN